MWDHRADSTISENGLEDCEHKVRLVLLGFVDKR